MRKAHLCLVYTCALISTSQALDLDGDGMCNVWEARYGAGALSPQTDTDKDGHSNLKESIAGTDPFSRESFIHVTPVETQEGSFEVSVNSVPGKEYLLQKSNDLVGAWSPVGASVIASENTLTFPITSTDNAFYRILVRDADSDLDGVSNWAERQMDGFNPGLYDTFLTGLPEGDRAAMIALLNDLEGTAVTPTVTVQDAFEKEGTDAVITLTRSGSTDYPMTVYFKVTAPIEEGRGVASPSDYSAPENPQLIIPIGEDSVDLHISAVADNKIEVPELIDVLIGPNGTPARIRICDAANTLGNESLMIARLRPVSGTNSSASGISVLKLNGSNELATVTVDFSNLNGTLTNTQILNTSESILQSVPPFNFTGQPWEILAGSSYATDQELLDHHRKHAAKGL